MLPNVRTALPSFSFFFSIQRVRRLCLLVTRDSQQWISKIHIGAIVSRLRYWLIPWKRLFIKMKNDLTMLKFFFWSRGCDVNRDGWNDRDYMKWVRFWSWMKSRRSLISCSFGMGLSEKSHSFKVLGSGMLSWSSDCLTCRVYIVKTNCEKNKY